jgi:putative transposase
MPRSARLLVGGGCYHVMNRGNNRSAVFSSPGEYSAFVGLLRAAQERVRLDLLAVCLMPNHFHLVVTPRQSADIGLWMHWLLTTHSHRYHLRHGTSGRVWQGRYKAFPIERDQHLLTAMRYVERNALRAGLVARAEDWQWSSVAWRRAADQREELLAVPPVALPRNWMAVVNSPQTSVEVEALRACVNRQRPYGAETWVEAAPECVGLRRSGRPAGRPRKIPSTSAG